MPLIYGYTYARVPRAAIQSYVGILKSLTPLSNVIPRKISGDASHLRRPRVSRATRLLARRLASGLLFCEMPAPWPSAQLQSLPKSICFCGA